MFQLDLGFLKTVRNDKLPIESRKCGIADKVSKVVIFEITYLWVTFDKSFILIYAKLFHTKFHAPIFIPCS